MKRIQLILGVVVALVLLSGCASSYRGGTADSYNTRTGYPAVGSDTGM